MVSVACLSEVLCAIDVEEHSWFPILQQCSHQRRWDVGVPVVVAVITFVIVVLSAVVVVVVPEVASVPAVIGVVVPIPFLSVVVIVVVGVAASSIWTSLSLVAVAPVP